MKFTVITVCYNVRSTISDCLESVTKQDYEDLEHIIVDGGSTDGTVDIIKSFKGRFPERIQFVSERDRGIYDAMNKGIALAKSSYIGFLNADDFFASPQVVSRMAAVINQSGVDGCYANLEIVSAEDSRIILRHWFSGLMPDHKMKFGWHPAHPTFYLDSKFLKDGQGFRLQYSIAADYELMLRMIMKRQVKLIYLPEVTVKMRAGGVSNGSIKNIMKANKQCLDAWTENKMSSSIFLLPGKLFWKAQQRLRCAFK